MTPIPPLDRTSPTFRAEVDTYFSTRIPTLTTELNALSADLTIKQGLASAAAVSTNSDKIATAADRVQTGVDRVQTALDRAAAADSAATIGTTAAFSDANPIAKNAANNTKTARLDLSLISPSTQRVYQLPDKSGKVALIGDGGLAFLGEVTLAAPAAAIDFLTIFNNPAHDRFLITLHYMGIVTGTSNIALRYAVGGAVDASSTSYGSQPIIGNPIGSNNFIPLGPSTGNNANQYELTLFDKNYLSNRAGICYSLTTSSPYIGNINFGGGGLNPVSGFRIFVVSGSNIAAGAIVRVYGYAKS